MYCRMNKIDCDHANENNYCNLSACVNPNFVGNIHPIDKVYYIGEASNTDHLGESRWHTGTPEEEGWYVIQTNGSNHIGGNLMVVEKTDNGLWFDDSNLYCRVDSESIIAYQKIEPYKESEE